MRVRRTAAAAMGAAGAAVLLAGQGQAMAAPAGDPGTATIASSVLQVRVDRAFPRVVSYTDRRSGAVLHGQEDALGTVVIDGKPYTPEVTSRAGRDAVRYVLEFPGGTRIEAHLSVRGEVTEFAVDRIVEGDLKVGTIDIPGHSLVSVRSDQPGATVRSARLSLDKAKEGDTVLSVTKDTKPDAKPVGATYVVANTDKLAVAMENNSVYDKPTGEQTWDGSRFLRQTQAKDGYVKVGIGNGQWTHRAAGASKPSPLPFSRVVVTGNRNGDGKVDWQDAGIAMRSIMVEPIGAREQYKQVVPHIPFNFASQATNPFLATLDNVKRISLATDGLGQYTLLKGYQSEGHDSAHPDYGGNYNERAGGLADMNTLLRLGKRWNSDFGVHVNATESYPVAKSFSDRLVDPKNKQWDWLDQSYMIDHRRDLTSGDIARRFAQLRRETDPALNTLYIDVFRESGWNSDALQDALRGQGWKVTTEWGHGLERSALWSHWANETDYGGDGYRGQNSTLIRFVRNHEKDVWADRNALLGSSKLGTFEGWVGKTDWAKFYRLIWTDNLPAKFLQRNQIKTWADHEITFFGSTRVSDAAGRRQMFDGDRLVYDGGRYLLPWEGGKLYHYNPAGGTTTWKLPGGWRDAYVYKLTDQGRTLVGKAPVSGGQVTLNAAPDQPYVLYRSPAPKPSDPAWGQGGALRDPGFNSGDLSAWTVQGRASNVRNQLGDYEAVLGDGPASLSQKARLAPGDYIASAQVEVTGRRRAAITVNGAENHIDSSPAVNYVAADAKHDSRMQRIFVPFRVGRDGRATLTLSAGDGSGPVKFDNPRVVKGRATTKPGTLAFEDFENVPQGWGPFVKGDAGGSTDPRTHIAQKHAPYTQRGWNGKLVDDVLNGEESLKSRAENDGLVYRTIPGTVTFEPGRKYRVEFTYENAFAGHYAWMTSTGGGEAARTPLGVVTTPTRHSYEFTAGSDQAWVGLAKVGGDEGDAEFSLDDFTVTELP